MDTCYLAIARVGDDAPWRIIAADRQRKGARDLALDKLVALMDDNAAAAQLLMSLKVITLGSAARLGYIFEC